MFHTYIINKFLEFLETASIVVIYYKIIKEIIEKNVLSVIRRICLHYLANILNVSCFSILR